MSHTLLLADDSVTTHRVVELTLAGEGVRVVSVSDGQQALDRLAVEPPDIVLAAILMRKVGGYEIAEHVAKTPALAGVPVLLLRGAFDTVDDERVERSGAAGVIVKPFEPGIVIKRVKELLGLSGDRPAAPVRGRLVTDGEPPPQRPPTGPRGVGPPPPSPVHPLEVAPSAPPRDAHLPVPPAAWDELREQAGLAPDAASVEVPAAGDDYFDRLDAAFDNLDAQLSGTATKPATAPPTRPPAAAETAPKDPVFEVDNEWFPNDPRGSASVAAPVEPAAAVPPPAPAPPAPAPQAAAPEHVPEPAPAVAPVEPVALLEPAAPVVAPAAPVVAPAAPVLAPVPLAEHLTLVPSGAVADAFESLLAAEQGEAPEPQAPVIEISDEIIERIATRVAEHLTDGVLIETVTEIVSGVSERLVREEIERIRSRAEASKKS
jgi:CheY-like chemotaxis protein